MKLKIASIILLAMSILLILFGCSKKDLGNALETFDMGNTEIIEYQAEYGGQVVLPITDLNTINPLVTQDISYYYFSKLIFESLFELDEELNVQPQLAAHYRIEDGIIRIRLRDDVLWHDGERFTAEDVAFTINAIKYAKDSSSYVSLWETLVGNYHPFNINRLIKVDVIDDHNLEIEFDLDFGNCIEALIFPIIPRHQFVSNREDAGSYVKALDYENYTPIGTGPYKFASYDKHKELNLEYFENYREGRPYIDRITGKILEDQELALTTFEVGQIDLAMAIGVDWEKFTQIKRVKIIEFISQDYEFLGFNFSNPAFSREGSNLLRKAMAYGINRQSIIQKVYLGHATQMDLPIHPNSWLISDSANTYGYNPGKAKDELRKLGWKDIDGDGYYEDENGEEIIFRLTSNSYNPLRCKVADLIVEDLDNIGIKIVKDYPQKSENISEEMVIEQWDQLNKQLLLGDYDIVLTGWSLPSTPELSFAFHSNQIKRGNNIIKYSDETMDELLEEAFISLDKDRKKEVYGRLQERIVDDLPYLSLYFRNKALLIDKKIMGKIEPTSYNIYRNINTWYIPKEFQDKMVEK